MILGMVLKVDLISGGTNPRITNLSEIMKKHLFLIISLLSMVLNTMAAPTKDFNDNYRFIFYAVLEGCYEDGLATTNVDQILLMNTNVGFVHFVYACPICLPTIHALQAYRSRTKAVRRTEDARDDVRFRIELGTNQKTLQRPPL